MSILRGMSNFSWFEFILVIIACCENSTAQNAEEFIIDFEKPLDDQIRHFPPTSQAIQLQSDLKYSEKPLWPLQWYMNEEILTVDEHEYFPSMKIAKMHEKGIKGDGIGVVIIGNSPVNCQHVAIQNRCQAKDSSTSLSNYPGKSLVYLFRKKYRLPAPSGVSSGIAGIIGMSDDGVIGGVGIAPKCHIGSVVIQPSASNGSPEYCAAKIIARNTSPPAELFVHAWVLPYLDYERSILHALDDISLLNFGDPRIVLKPHVMTGTKNGVRSNSCQCNEYASADSVFLFGRVEYCGYLPPTSESCASLFGVVYSDGLGDKLYYNVVTIDSEKLTSFRCAKNYYLDTDPAVGIAGGVIALIIDCFRRKFQRSPSVSDLAFLLAFSLTSEPLQDTNILWFTNGIGLMYSLQAGFGVPNMLNVESRLENWTPTDFPIIYEVDRFTREIEFQCRHDDSRKTLTYLSNLVCNFHISNAQSHLHIQLVTVQLSAKLVNRGALTVYLISPAGTVSCILEGRPYDTDKNKYKKLLLRSNHFIGEQLGGQWSIRFYTYQENSKSIYSEDILPANDANKPIHSGENDQKSSSSSLVNPEPAPAVISSTKNGPRPISFVKNREPNAVNLSEIKFRFVLHKRLPAKLNLEPQVKSDAEIEKNFELLKAWVDFRHYVYAKVDPKKENYFHPEFENPAKILRRHVKQLIMLQKNENIDSVFRMKSSRSTADVNEPTQ